MRIPVSMKPGRGSGSFYTLSALTQDSWFLLSSTMALVVAGAAFGGAILWQQTSSIKVYPLIEVARFTSAQVGDYDAVPISSINGAQSTGKLFAGYEIKLVDFCALQAHGLVDRLIADVARRRTAKVIIDDNNDGELVVANADFSAATCERVRRNNKRYKDVSVVFDQTVPVPLGDGAPSYFLALKDKAQAAVAGPAK